MFSKLSVVVISVLVSSRLHRRTGIRANMIFADPCCRHPHAPQHHPAGDPTGFPSVLSSVVPSNSAGAGRQQFLIQDLNVDVGLNCTIISNNCGGTTVTCDAPEEERGGLIASNCIPITL
ncbi:hypothetical protein B0H10DRAFT_1949649 [Mycena sp. CBHHK59/15]|nr:hypothetical protein B0H10DRAFT_1949649 [Mycena sp. CBHHK59/15]